MAEVTVFDWEDEIVNDGEDKEFIVLEPGEYAFEVNKFERSTYTPSANAKTPACKMALVTIKISTKEGDCYIVDKFPMASTMEWKISSFFRSIGMKKHGEPIKIDWEGAIGKTGICKVTKTEGTKKDGVFFNNIDRYVDPRATTEGGDDEWS